MYYWTEEDVENSINKLQNIDPKTLKDTRKKDIDKYINELIELSKVEEMSENNPLTYMDFVNQDIDYFKKHKFLTKDIIDFSNNNSTEHAIYKDFTKFSLNNEQLLEITHDFYKDQDKEIFNQFLKVFNERYKSVKFHRDCNEPRKAYTTGIPFIKDVYMQLENENNIQSLFIAFHEFAHATSFMLNDMHLFEPEKAILAEFDSTFAELIGADYLRANYNLGEEDYYLLLRNTITITNASIMKYKMDIANYQKAQKIKGIRRLEKEIKNNFGLNQEYIEQVIATETEFEVPYIIGYIFAIELYTLYKKDKEQALFILKEFIKAKDLSSKGYYKYLQLLGLIPNLNSKNFLENIDNNYSLLLKK